MDEVAQSNPTPTSLDVDASLVQELRSLSMGKGFDASMPMGWRWIPLPARSRHDAGWCGTVCHLIVR